MIFPGTARPLWPAMATGGLMDGTTRLARNGGEPVYHYSFLSTFADACVVPERSCVRIDADVPFDDRGSRRLRRVDRGRCRVADGGSATGDRVAIVGCGGVGLSALLAAKAVGAEPVVAVDAAASKLEFAREFGADRTVLVGSTPAETAEAVREQSGGGVDYAIEATGRPEAMETAFLSTRQRGAAVLIGIPRADAVLELPALTIPRMERRVLGSIYGSTGQSATSRRRSSSTAPGGFRSTSSSPTDSHWTKSSAPSSSCARVKRFASSSTRRP